MRDRKKHWPDEDPWPPDLPRLSAVGQPGMQHYQALLKWMKAMCEWAEHVRDDIVRLEGRAGLGAGDPGDPPPQPWKE